MYSLTRACSIMWYINYDCKLRIHARPDQGQHTSIGLQQFSSLIRL